MSVVSGRSFGSSVVSLACITSMCSVQCFRGGHSLRLAFWPEYYFILNHIIWKKLLLPCIYKRLVKFCHSLSYFCTFKQRCPLRKSSGSSRVQNLCNLRCPASKIGSRTKIASSRNFPYLKKSWKWWKVVIFFSKL